MHVYICPYCDPCADSNLVRVKDSSIKCEHKKKTCEKNDYKCKEVMQCNKCESSFVLSGDFLKKQKRKIKDG